jgi:hypothetical protein
MCVYVCMCASKVMHTLSHRMDPPPCRQRGLPCTLPTPQCDSSRPQGPAHMVLASGCTARNTHRHFNGPGQRHPAAVGVFADVQRDRGALRGSPLSEGCLECQLQLGLGKIACVGG